MQMISFQLANMCTAPGGAAPGGGRATPSPPDHPSYVSVNTTCGSTRHSPKRTNPPTQTKANRRVAARHRARRYTLFLNAQAAEGRLSTPPHRPPGRGQPRRAHPSGDRLARRRREKPGTPKAHPRPRPRPPKEARAPRRAANTGGRWRVPPPLLTIIRTPGDV